MDPYLAHPFRWPSLHAQLIARLPGVIESLLPARYALSVDEHVYLSVPGDELRLRRPHALVVDTGRSAAQPATDASVATLPHAVEIEIAGDPVVRETYLTVRDLHANEVVVT